MNTTTKNTTVISYTNLFDCVSNRISELFEVDIEKARGILLDYELKEGKEAVKAIFGFMRYIATHDDKRFNDTLIVKSVFAHDLNGAGTKGFLPRSHGYLKYFND